MNLHDLFFHFDPDSLVPTAISLMDPISPKIETSFVFTKEINADFVFRFIRKKIAMKITEDLSAKSKRLGIKDYYPGNKKLQQVTVEKRLEKQEVHRL